MHTLITYFLIAITFVAMLIGATSCGLVKNKSVRQLDSTVSLAMHKSELSIEHTEEDLPSIVYPEQSELEGEFDPTDTAEQKATSDKIDISVKKGKNGKLKVKATAKSQAVPVTGKKTTTKINSKDTSGTSDVHVATKEKQKEVKKTDYTPFILGGVIVLLLLIYLNKDRIKKFFKHFFTWNIFH